MLCCVTILVYEKNLIDETSKISPTPNCNQNLFEPSVPTNHEALCYLCFSLCPCEWSLPQRNQGTPIAAASARDG